jgi:tRNA(Ile)-lysidine synthase
VPELAERVLKTIRKHELIKSGDRVAVAVSGGADSVALLCLLLALRSELGTVLSVAHVNHKLRGDESDEDERFVAELAGRHGLELHCCAAPIGPAGGSGIEAAARKLRYDFFRRLAREQRIAKVATAHTLDDQAETVLLRVLRGSGLRGLSGIHPRFILREKGRLLGEIVRPLLQYRRAELQEFLREQAQAWREDSSNLDRTFLRNRVRHALLPVLTENFGSAVENLADLAEIARAEEEHWASVHPEIRAPSGGPDDEPAGERSLRIVSLLTLPLAAQRRLIRAWLEAGVPDLSLSFRLIEEVLELVRGPAGRKLELTGGRVLRRTQQELRFNPASDQPQPTEYEYRLAIPGRIEVPELGIRIEAVVADQNSVPDAERERLLDPARLPKELTIRNWRPGDRFWPAHTKEEKKVKELLNDRQICGAKKKLWPVAVAEGYGLVWMRGFLVPARLQPPAGAPQALLVREMPGLDAGATK